MPPTSIEPDPRQLAPIDEALHQAQASLSVLDAKMTRLLGTAFHNGPLAEQRLAQLVRRGGIERAGAVLEDRHPTIARLYIGFLRGSLFTPGERRRAKAAITELAPLLEQRVQLALKVLDLHEARRALLERADQTRIEGLRRQWSHVPRRSRGRSET